MDFKVIRNDIVRMDVDAIVLPANSKLKEGSGASEAIFKAAGEESLKNKCKEIVKKKGEIRVGTAVPTLGYDLDATYIIHAVVPVWKGGNSNEYELLSSSYFSSLELADLLGCESVAIPLLASGNNKFNLNLAVEIAINSIEAFTASNQLSEVYLIVYGMRACDEIRKRGIPLSELIDEAYVMGKDEKHIPHAGKVKRELKNTAKLYLDKAIEEAMQKIQDPNTVQTVIKLGFDVVKKLI